MSSAQQTRSKACGGPHAVQLYQQEGTLLESLVRFFTEGAAAGDGALLIATAEHRDALRARLRAAGVAEDALPIEADATQAAERLVPVDLPWWEGFHGMVAPLLAKARARSRSGEVRVFGEIVDLLWRAGRRSAAARLEELWNELGGLERFTLLCGYCLDSFGRDVSVAIPDELATVAGCHDEIAAPIGDPELQLRLIEATSRMRNRLEAALREALHEKAMTERELRESRAALEGILARRSFLSDASAALSASLDYEATLGTVARLAIPRIADGCVVDVADELARPGGRVVIEHRDPARREILRELRRRFPPQLDDAHGFGRVIRTGEPQLAADAGALLGGLSPERRAMLERLGLRSFVFVPMTARGRVVGAIALLMDSDRAPFGAEDLAMAVELGARAGIAVDNARLYREARSADRRKDEFLAMLGHELRNPLAPMLTALQLMALRGAGFERERSVVERQVRHLERLVADLLDVSRISRGKMELKLEPVEVSVVVQKALELAGPLLQERRHSLHVEVPGSGLRVAADETRLAQVIANLLTNAAKYTDAGGHVTVRATREGEQVRLSVTDDGMGIPPELLPRIFDLFVQGKRVLDRAQGGLGIGLTLVRTLTELHGGLIEAHSAGSGRGSEFVIRLPLLSQLALPEPQPEAEPAAGSSPTLRVLVVDDNVDAADMLADALRLLGHEVSIAHDGAEALAALDRERPDVALLDIGLPVMDGYELARRIRANRDRRPPRLIAITGYGQESDRARARDAGFQLHLVKPVDVNGLARIIAPDRDRS